MKNKSRFYKLYIKRLIIRIVILLITISIYILKPNSFNVAKGFNMLKEFSLLDILWLIWMFDMIFQLCKVPKYLPLGSQKYLATRYISESKLLDKKIIKKNKKKMIEDSISVAIVWIIFVTIIDMLYINGNISYEIVIPISTIFYVCDIICVIGWCPFKNLIMHNKCCTTCRIFNWDHAMMFLPLIAIPGLWTYSLVAVSLIVLVIWEIACIRYPERFIEKTNCALRCNNCKDRLCGKDDLKVLN